MADDDDGVIEKLRGYGAWSLEFSESDRAEYRYRCEIGTPGHTRAAYGTSALEAIDNAVAVWERSRPVKKS